MASFHPLEPPCVPLSAASPLLRAHVLIHSLSQICSKDAPDPGTRDAAMSRAGGADVATGAMDSDRSKGEYAPSLMQADPVETRNTE